MIHKLPWWVGLGGAVLAFIAGIVNAVGFESFTHQAVTHLTGTTSQLGLAIGHGELALAPHLLLLIGSFFAGAVVSGVVVHAATLKLGRRYGAVLTLESLLLLLAIALLRQRMVAGEYVASAACGLQNAMASMYSGAILRTTHVSGIITDLGVLLGHKLRGDAVDGRRVRLLGLVLLGFVVGSIAGAVLFGWFDYGALYVPAALTGSAGLLYAGLRHRALVRERAALAAGRALHGGGEAAREAARDAGREPPQGESS